MSRSRLLSLFVLSFAVLAVLSCRNRKTEPVAPVDPEVSPPAIAVDDDGLLIRLSHADPSAAERTPAPVAETTPLSAAATSAVLARLPALPSRPGDVQEFAMRRASAPPPRAGATVVDAFPPKPEGPGARPRPKGPLAVARFAPEGEVPVAPHLSVTFTHPMVPVSSLDALAAKDVPVTLDPQPADGQWRWVGTRTLLFEPTERFAMATRYQVSVAEGTRSALGTALEKAERWSFTTPAPSVEHVYPKDQPTVLRPVIFARFDQRIDPAAVLETIEVKARRKARALRLATAEEIEADATVAQLVAQAEDGRWLAFVPTEPLPAAAPVSVRIGPGIPSAEGPLTSDGSHRVSFRTYGPMEVTEHRCGWDGECPPGAAFEVTFSNPIDLETFERSMITAEPAIDGMTVEAYGDALYVMGATTGRTTYELTVSGRVRDHFGQALGEARSLRFRVTKAPRSLYMLSSGLTVLDPAATGRVSVFSTNHSKLRVRMWSVKPEDWPAYVRSTERAGDPEEFSPPGRKVFDEEVKVRRDPDALVETSLDLGPALTKGHGHVIVAVEQTDRPKEPWMLERTQAWVQVTDLALQAHLDAERMLVWATQLADGTPVDDAEVELRPVGLRGRTDARGLASLPLRPEGAQMIVVRRGDDVAFLPESVWWWNESGGWRSHDAEPALRWYVFDDRGLYRPGEEVRVKGWVRTVDPGLGGDVGGVPPKVKQASYVLSDSQGNRVQEGTLRLNPFGAFDLTLSLPDTINLGTGSLVVSALPRGSMPGSETWHPVRIEEFRRPEYEVSTQVDEGPHVVGEHAVATVEAEYFAGGGLANADVSWRVTSSPGWYQPPGHDRFVFGVFRPWWMFWGGWGPPDPAEQPRTVEFQALTDAAGEHHLRMDFVSVKPARAMSVTAEARVTDVNRQAWSSSTSLVVHPSSLYVGLRSERSFVRAGEDLEIDLVVTDIDGKIRAGVPVRVRSVRTEQHQEHGEWVEEELDEQVCETTSGEAPVRCTLPVAEGGSHRVEAVVLDERERQNRTEFSAWVAGGQLPSPADATREQVLLVPDREHYEGGQTAEISVSVPWAPAEALVTIQRSGLVEERTLHLDTTSATLEIPIEEAMTPSVTVQVDVVGSAPRRGEDGRVDPKLPRQPGYATGMVTLQVPPLRRTLSIDVAPARAKIEPGARTRVELTVRDADGRPVEDAEVALVVVDEAVLSLTGYSIPDPLPAFYGWRAPGVQGMYLHDYVMLARANALEQTRGAGYGRGGGGAPGGAKFAEAEAEGMDFMDDAAPPPPASPEEPETGAAFGMGGLGLARNEGSAGKPPPIALRSDFSALAHFSPSVRTDAAGRASVPITVPDNLTRYRITAVAVHGDRHFGKAESTVTARLPLMVRPSPPRFLNFGDEVQLPVVLHNQTEDPMTVDVAIRTAGLSLSGGAGQRVEVPAGDRVEVRFGARAEHAGTARVQVGATAGTRADASSFELPVWTPATTEAFATYGEIDAGGIVQPVAAPPGVFPQFGGLEITTSSTALQALTDAVLYLTSYPFECSEQIASRVLAVAALRDVLDAFEAEGLPPPKELEAAVVRDLDRLELMQGSDGGFSFWGRAYPSWPYLTVHVTHALERARAKGFAVPKGMRSRALAYLRDIESHFDRRTPQEVRRTIRAYALYVLRLAGEPKVRQAKLLVAETGVEGLPLEALAWVLPTLHDDADTKALAAKIERHLGNRVAETAAAAHFVTHYEDGEHLLLHSDRRVDALVLEALTITEPSSDLVPKLVRGLLGHRTKGRWSSTQENAFVLVALDRYFGEYEKATPNFVAKAWLGESFAGKHAFRGRTTERHHVDVPMAWLAEHEGTQDLVLNKEGRGRLYYRVGMRYAPRDLMLPPRDAGFVVERRYEAVDDESDVRRDADGTWHIAAGARVRVRVTMVAQARRTHVALVDPLPAGLEPLNPALATTGALPADPEDPDRGGWWWWMRPWYEHQNLRDDRVEAFASLLWAGVHDYDYIARATTPGRFVVPPPRAEQMYHPETFGRGRGDRVIVE